MHWAQYRDYIRVTQTNCAYQLIRISDHENRRQYQIRWQGQIEHDGTRSSNGITMRFVRTVSYYVTSGHPPSSRIAEFAVAPGQYNGSVCLRMTVPAQLPNFKSLLHRYG